MEATALAAATMLKKPAADVVENTANNSPTKPSQVVGEVPLLAQMQQAMDRLDDVMKRQDVGDVVVTRKQSCLLKDHIEPRPDFANVKFSLKNRFSHLASFRKKKIIENIEDLKQKCVAVIGLGGIGALVAEMFTRTTNISERTNTQYPIQYAVVMYGVVKMASMTRMHYLPEHVDMSKVQASRLYLRQLNPHVEIETLHCNINDGMPARKS
ncbi:hypothetical protein AaE_007050 [Aphanomyces astaci]|uniref:THIF-type NAD/FAD binding fold domain-containing protein n=1 Tax=Aphanomyces astaci TaxID=112090 RepID=A0A6A5AJ85_APHAT|nr:hypothetical protein AaE_007050 [Aphanomyces astaci]